MTERECGREVSGLGRTLPRVALTDVTKSAVLAAVTEFDRLGRDRFLETSGFGRAKNYFLERDGKLYDSKAIVGYAHGISGDRPWRSNDFTGGDKTVAERLRTLGFAVRHLRNPDWTWDEIVLACAMVEDNGWRTVAQENPRARTLSDMLQSTAIHPLERRRPDFRNPAGVERKTADLVSCLPGHNRTNGNGLDVEVVKAFRDRPDEMHASARAIEEALRAWGDATHSLPDTDIPDDGADEGRVLLKAHLRRERNATLKPRKIAEAKRLGRAIACEACGFDFFETYGDRGEDYIECHHRTPLHVTGAVNTLLKDLALICSNCHRMVHRSTPWLTVEEVHDLVQRRRSEAGEG